MKKKIIESSIVLFNEQGINQTSFRDIAASLNISDGHVRYYFRNKEILLLTIFSLLDREIISITDQNPIEHKNIELNLKTKFEKVFKRMVEYRFFLIESPNTIYQFPELAIAYKNLFINRKSLFLNNFKELERLNYFKKSFTPEIQEKVFYNIFLISDAWIRSYTILNNQKPDEDAIIFHVDLILSILRPHIRLLKKYP